MFQCRGHLPGTALSSPPAEADTSMHALLEQLANPARACVEAASSNNTRRAYAADWTHLAAW
jgi:hypothetical protein